MRFFDKARWMMTLGLAIGVGMTSLASAQENARPEGGLLLIFPSGDRASGTLMIEAMAPAEVPVGRTFDYTIKVTNISKNLVLEDVRVHQSTVEGFSIEKSEPKTESGDSGKTSWSLPRLKPGESHQISVSALSDKEGIEAGCLQVDYKPSLCLTTRFVKPELQLTKEAPEQADLCEQIAYHYIVKNTGSGAAKNVKLTEDLPNGLTTTDGKNKISYNVGDLAPGQIREYTVNLNASQTGDYSSRAVAQNDNDLKANSNKITTSVREAKLNVAIKGPDAQNVNQPTTYQVEVTNEGGATAQGTTLKVQVDNDSRVVRVSKSAPGSIVPNQSSGTLSWDLGELEPGKSSVVSFTTRGESKATLEHVATATALCARGGDKAASSTTRITTEILTYPALLLEMIDQQDPVQVGGTEVYTITVLNQGTGPDHNVKIVCDIPDEYEFVEVSGPGNPKPDGNTITFGPIDKLDARERATWNLSLKAKKAGDIRTKIDLSSDYLSKPIVEYEPTRLID